MKPNQNCGGPGMMPCGGRPPMSGGYSNGRPEPMPGSMCPPVGGNGMGCGCQRPMPGPQPIQQPRMFEPQAESRGMNFNREDFPIGMGYVPMQRWETPYSMAQSLQRGTIFPSLDDPFMMGRCRR